ncbi:MAG: hypothetical protein RLP44_13120 [Aggregatilineales bacterium]
MMGSSTMDLSPPDRNGVDVRGRQVAVNDAALLPEHTAPPTA